MKLAAAIADARRTLRIQRRQAPYWRQAMLAAQSGRHRLWQYRLWILASAMPPLLVPLALWAGKAQSSRLWGFFALLAVLASSGHRFQRDALRFSATDVLRQPSKAGIVLARLWQSLPRLLFHGACWAAGFAVVLGDAMARRPLHAALLLLAVALTPLAYGIGKLRVRLLGAGQSSLGPLLLPTLAVLLVLPVWRSGWHWNGEDTALAVTGSLLLLLSLPPNLIAWVREPRLHLRLLVAELSLLPRLLVLIGCFLPVGDGALQAAPLALATVLVLTGIALLRLPGAVQSAEESTGGSAIGSRDDPGPAPSRRRERPVAMPQTHRGRRSLMGASWFLYRRRTWPRRGELRTIGDAVAQLPQLIFLLLLHCFGLLLAMVTMLGDPRPAHALLAVLAGLLVPNHVSVDLRHGLHRLGVDYTAQVRHNLGSFFLCVALPSLLLATATAAWSGFDPGRLRLLLVLAATLALRAGLRGLTSLRRAESVQGRQLLIGFVLLAGLA